MSWIDNLVTDFKGAKPTDRLLLRDVSIPDEPGLGQEIVEDECYLELYVESYRPEKARTFATTFKGVVYCSVTLSRLGDEDLQLTAVSKPDFLAKLAPGASEVIAVSRRMIGPVAWRGGALHLELGLFSVKTGNVLSPVLDLVTDISSVAGVGFAVAAKPFFPLVTKGLDLIAGQTADTAIEVAIDTDFSPAKTMAFALVDVPKTTLEGRRIAVDPADRKLRVDGKPLEAGYCLFSIRKTNKKANFAAIPDVATRYKKFQQYVKDQKKKEAAEALEAFRLTTLASSDLITSDAEWLAARAKALYDKAFPAGLALKHAVAEPPPPDLEHIGLYENGA